MAYFRRLPSGRWQATVKHPSGRRFTRSDPLKRVVQEWAAEVESQIRRGAFVDPAAGREALEEWWSSWLATRVLAQATQAKYESLWRAHVRPGFGSWPLSSIQSWDVEAWIAGMVRRNVGPSSLEASVRLLRLLLAEAVRHRLLQVNVAADARAPVPPRHVDRWLTGSEPAQLLEAITRADGSRRPERRDQPWPRVPDPVNRLFVRLMMDAGLRWQEAAGLHVNRVSLRRRVLLVREVAVRGRRVKPVPKSSAGQRTVPLTDALVEGLRVQLAGRGEGLVFASDGSGRPLDYTSWLRRVWYPAIEVAGLDDPQPTPHDCRHTYGSWLAEQGVPAHELAALMGHGSLRAVERYVHASEARLERARRAVGARWAHEGGVGGGAGDGEEEPGG